MNLRKVILTILLTLSGALMFSVLNSYVIMNKALEIAGFTTLQSFTNSVFDTWLIWAQFPLLIIIILVIFYLMIAENSLNEQARRSEKK